jgi:HPt (histidine-containing phosphotransfer) domain-containing protein
MTLAETVDLERLRDVADGEPRQMQKLVELYLRTAGGQMRQLRAAVAEQRPADVQHMAHSCAGSSAMIGMRAVIPPLRALEEAAAHGDLSDAPRMLEQTDRAYSQIQHYLQAQHLLV